MLPTPPGCPQSKYVGTGHPDINRFEWNLNIKRDTYASLIGHHSLTAYHAIAENESIGRIKYNFLQVRQPLPRAPSASSFARTAAACTGEAMGGVQICSCCFRRWTVS